VVAYLIVFLVAAGTTSVLTPLVRRLAVRFGAIDAPSERKLHTIPTPTMGGLAMWGGFLVAIGVSRVLPFFEPMNAAAVEPLAAVVTCTMMVGLGVIDDRRGTSALAKLTAQIFIAGILILLGVQLAFFVLPGEGLAVLGADEAVPLTILWVLAAANAINLVDGLDGLAAGMVAIAAATFFIYMVRGADLSESASVAALLSAITVGVCVGFLPWNFHPAKIFMGDTGSMLLGMLVAVATISGVGLNPFPPERGDVAVIALPLLVPLLVLAIPLLDVVLAIVRRTRKGLGIAHADKEHIFHRLMDIGHGHRQTVLLMYLWSALVCGSALAIGVIDGLLVAGAIVAVAIMLFLVTALPRLLERRRNGDANGEDEPERATDHAGTPGVTFAPSGPTAKHAPGAAPPDPTAP
jgi:UDP-GlcNAc:undecaprenyl-phosphate/decaprenyl-phosphate GlcNAc-1-phosphate transferase